MVGTKRILPIHLAYNYLGCALPTSDGLAVPSIHGPLIGCLAESVEALTVISYERPTEARSGEDDVDHVISGGDVRWLSLGPKGTWRDAWRRRSRSREIVRSASRDWDVLCFRLPDRRLASVSRSHRCPRVAVIDGSVLGDEAKTSPMSPGRRLLRNAVVWSTEREARRTMSSAGVVFVNSPFLAERHSDIAKVVEVVPWSLRSARFSHVAGDRLTGTSPRFLIAGRITPYKGVFDALEAFRRIETTTPGATLHVVGDGPALPELRRSVSRHGLDGSVTFYGWLPLDESLFSLYASMDVLLHLSEAESFPRVVWDALAQSVLVVCTPVGGLPHMLGDEREVLFVPVGDVGAATRAVGRLATDATLRSRLLHAGYERARETDLERVTDRIVERMLDVWPELDGGRPTTEAHPTREREVR